MGKNGAYGVHCGVRALCFLMMVRWCIGSMCEGRTDIGYCVRSFIWNQVKYAILEKKGVI